MAKKIKRKSAAEIAAELMVHRARSLEAVGMQPEAAALAQHEGVEITREGEEHGQARKKAGHDVARRLDAFAALKDGMEKGCFDAARLYEHQILIRRGENDRGPATERVDRTAGFTTDAMIDAARWVEEVNARLPPRDWWLLMELISPSRDLGGWRETVAHITGETHTHSQGAAVRAMTVNLRDAIEAREKARTAKARKAA